MNHARLAARPWEVVRLRVCYCPRGIRHLPAALIVFERETRIANFDCLRLPAFRRAAFRPDPLGPGQGESCCCKIVNKDQACARRNTGG